MQTLQPKAIRVYILMLGLIVLFQAAPCLGFNTTRDYTETLRNEQGYLLEGSHYLVFNIYSTEGVKQEWSLSKRMHLDKGRFTQGLPDIFFNGKYTLVIQIMEGQIPVLTRRFALPHAQVPGPEAAIETAPVPPVAIPRHWAILFGAGFILLFAAMKFNTWPDDADTGLNLPPRYFTTFNRYMIYCLVYLGLTEAFFLMMVFSPDFFVALNISFGISPNHVLIKSFSENTVLWSVFIVTGVLPALPWINKVELALRRKLHKMAFIPAQAKSAIFEFNTYPLRFKANPTIVNRIIQETKTKFERYDFFKQDKSHLHKWCKLNYLLFQVNDWYQKEKFENKAQLSEVLKEKFTREFDHLKEDMDKLRQLDASQPDPSRTKDYKTWLENRIHRSLDTLLDKVYTCISCTILSAEKTPHKRVQGYKFFGLYPQNSEKVYFDLDTIILSVFFIVLSILIPCMAIMVSTDFLGFKSNVLKGPQSITIWVVYGVAMHGITLVLCSGLLQYLQSHRFVDNAHRISVRALSFLTGYLVGLLILAAGRYFTSDQGLVLDNSFYFWAVFPGVTGFFTAYHLDVTIPGNKDILRTAFFQAATTCLTAVVVCFLLNVTDIVLYNATLLISFSVGYAIGYSYPYGYRNREKQNRLLQDRGRTMHRFKCNLGLNIVTDQKTDQTPVYCSAVDINANAVKINTPIDSRQGQKLDIVFDSSLQVAARIIRKAADHAVLKFIYDDRATGRLIQARIDQNSFAYSF